MNIFTDIGKVKLNNPVVTIGNFDGVHLGHRKILKQVIKRANETGKDSLLITFWPHPRAVLSKDSDGMQFITTQEEKYALLKETGLENVLVIPFTKEFSLLPYNHFIKNYLVDGLQISHLVVGYNHHFGKNREGNYEKLELLANQFGFGIEKTEPALLQDITISSSKTRWHLQNGHIETANDMLGSTWFISGKVIKGNQIGNKLGFPTANISTPKEKLLPKTGVYAVYVLNGNNCFKGMLNIGYRPTLGESPELRVETHIFNFNKILYGQHLKVYLKTRIRDEKKFETLDALKAQIGKDKETAINAL